MIAGTARSMGITVEDVVKIYRRKKN